MSIKKLILPAANRLAGDYINAKPEATCFFAYQRFDLPAHTARLQWLREQSWPHRKQLADGLLQYNRSIGNDGAAIEKIERLRKPDTYVVIGGQQAGVMTGPLYTIFKAIDLIKTADHLQQELNVPVVPVFWIAGEDHDLDEINQLHAMVDGTEPMKWQLPLDKRARISASMLPVEQKLIARLVDDFFNSHPETEYTASLRKLAKESAQQSATLVDWFARLMAQLFGPYGLVFVESSASFVRQLEQPLFSRFISQSEQINEILSRTQQSIIQAGYEPQLQLSRHQAQFFLYEAGERVLLERHGGDFRSKDGRLTYSEQELLAILDSQPERYSANVVSRPIMQEHIFPTLAFIGGAGEIAYWAYYKELFQFFGMQLPIVKLRTSVTLLEGAVDRLINHQSIDINEILAGSTEWKQQILESQLPLAETAVKFEQAGEAIRALHQPLADYAVEIDPGLQSLAAKNLDLIMKQLQFLQTRTEQSILAQHAVTVNRLERIQLSLRPFGKPQERVYNLFSYLNKQGMNLIDRLMEIDVCDNRHHQLLYL